MGRGSKSAFAGREERRVVGGEGRGLEEEEEEERRGWRGGEDCEQNRRSHGKLD